MQNKFGGLFNLIPFFKPYKRDVFFASLALLVTALMILFFGRIIKYLIDLGFVENNKNLLNIGFLIFIAAVLIMAIAGYFRSSLINAVAEKVIADLRKKVYAHIIKVSAEFFELTKTGDVISRLTVDSALLYNIISSTISFLLRNSLLFLGGICFLFFTSIKLALVLMAIIPIAILPIILMAKKIKNLSNQLQASVALLGSHIEETVNGVKTIQSYLCEEKEIRNFAGFINDSLKIALTKINVKSSLIAAVITFAFGGIALVLWVGSHEVLAGKMSSGDLSSFIFYAVITATSLVALSQIAGQLQAASSAANRIFELLKIESPVKESLNCQAFTPSQDITIKLENVNFSYPSRKDFLALKDFNLEIKPNEKIAIVGLSGAGKSTILQLLLRFYDVNSGKISLNNIDIKSLSFANLRKNFSYISQDCFIFSGTVFDNIAYADNSITKAQVEKIISQNEALNFINKLPQKLDTFVGEKGVKLSGGERQRIAFARAIIKDSPILLLDEATSALDNENHKAIIDAIAMSAQNKTVITIAHKLSAVIGSNRIIFIKDGEIAEVGNHQELLAKNGFYKKIYEMEMVVGEVNPPTLL
jgi:ATP-binding cassette subfamily B protein